MSTGSDTTVALILTPSSERLTDLIEKMPIWAVDVPEHQKRSQVPMKRTYQDWLTLYEAHSLSLEDECLNQIRAIEEHFTDMSQVLLVGLEKSSKLENDLCELGYVLEQHGIQLMARRMTD